MSNVLHSIHLMSKMMYEGFKGFSKIALNKFDDIDLTPDEIPNAQCSNPQNNLEADLGILSYAQM